MTSHLLAAELSNLIQESKKKNSDLKTASENALRDLRALPATSEAQLAVDLQRRPLFANPFLTACKTKNAKLALPAVSCLQRLVVSGGVPSERLQEVLQAFQECVSLGLDIQLRILQALPSLLQNYADHLEDELQANVLQICTSLQQVKTVAVASTASATLQQAFSFIFEKVETEDGRPDESVRTHHVPVDGEDVAVHTAAFDAYRAFEDICLMTEGKPAQYIRKATISSAFGLELIEGALLNHANVFHAHPEQTQLLLKRVMPLVNRFLSEKPGFAVTVRTVRVLCILLREHLSAIESECEIALGFLNHILDTDSITTWRRALCLEAFRIIYFNAELVVNLYSAFDAREDKKNIVQDNLAAFVRLAAEKPSLIGLGQQSTVPSTEAVSRAAEQEQAVIEAGNAAGMIGSDFGVSEINVAGISTQWSTMKVPCLDQLDKTDGPNIPETYVYSLVLTCINSLTEVLAKVVLPVTIQSQQKPIRKVRPSAKSRVDDSQEPPTINGPGGRTDSPGPQRQSSRSLPANPLDLKDHPANKSIAITATLITDCWPAILASSSTFLYATLDADFYRGLVRSVQKFTQVAGILRLATPRDAFLTTLSKAAVPPSLLKNDSLVTPTSTLMSPEGKTPTRGLMSPSTESFFTQASTDSPSRSHRGSAEASGPTLTQRNLMCLRALINLAIALGPILDQGWSIVLESIQKANVLLATSRNVAAARELKSPTQASIADGLSVQTNLSSEIAAVESAVTRLFQSTHEYPNDSFKILLTALCGLLRGTGGFDAPVTLKTPTKVQRRVPSIAGISASSAVQPEYGHFALSKLGEIARVNLRRLVYDAADGGWDLLVGTATEMSTSFDEDNTARLLAANVLSTIAAESVVFASSDDEGIRHDVQQRSLSALQNGIKALQGRHNMKPGLLMPADADVQQSFLDSLRSILERCGDSIVTGWNTVFYIIGTTFVPDGHSTSYQDGEPKAEAKRESHHTGVISIKLARTAFSSLQLICSDFLNIIPKSCASALTNLLSQFCSQTSDMNISLTAITLFWNVSDNLQSQITNFNLPGNFEEYESPIREEAKLVFGAERGSATAMWMILQQRLAALTKDPRADVRNGAIHTIFRTFDSCGDQFSDEIWSLSIKTVVFLTLQTNVEQQESLRARGEQMDIAETNALNGSSKVIIESSTHLFNTYLERLSTLPTFEDVWHSLLEYFASYIDEESYVLSSICFTAVTSILSTAEDRTLIGSKTINEAASLWARDIPKGPPSVENDPASQDKAFVAYVNTAKELYRLIAPEITGKHSVIILSRLQACIEASSSTPYLNDVDQQTTLQSQVLECYGMIRSELKGVSAKVIQGLSDFVRLPYKKHSGSVGTHEFTFVAFAKRATQMLEEVVSAHALKMDIFESKAVMQCLEALSQAIQMKYKWMRQGKQPSLWQMATLSAIAIIQTILPATKKLSLDAGTMHTIWLRIISVVEAVHDAEYEEQPPISVLLPDETSDLRCASSLRRIVTPYLAEDSIPPLIRRAYVQALLRISIIHPSRFDALPPLDPSEANSMTLLQDLYNIRLGRAYDPPFNPRIRTCYGCLDELFDLASTPASKREELRHDSQSKYGGGGAEDGQEAHDPDNASTIASTALPHLLFRCGLPLRRYIADQPLRGRMPTPMSQRLELMHILQRVARLRCKREAVAELERDLQKYGRPAGGLVNGVGEGRGGAARAIEVSDPELKHLEYLAPLVHRALPEARWDDEVAGAMRGLLDGVLR